MENTSDESHVNVEKEAGERLTRGGWSFELDVLLREKRDKREHRAYGLLAVPVSARRDEKDAMLATVNTSTNQARRRG